MIPGLPRWATNNNYAAAPGAPNPTKAPPAAGQIADGYQPDAAVSPQIWNYWRWAAAALLAGCSSMRLLNWQEGDATVLATEGVGAGMYEPVAGAHTYDYIAVGGAGGKLESIGMRAAQLWSVGFSPVGGGAYESTVGGGCRSAHDALGNRAIASALGGGAAVVFHSAAWAAWDATWGGAGFPGAWTPSDIDHDHLGGTGVWIVSDPNVAGPGELWVSPAPGVPWANPVATPGFGGGQGPSLVRHTHHAAGMLYPDDPGNLCWVALSPLHRSYSLDGWNWVPAAGHPWAAVPYDLAYSHLGTQWIGVLLDGGPNGYLVYSDDNFSNATKSAAFGAAGCPVDTQINNPTFAKIATDGFGDWLLGIIDCTSGDFELHASWDNGVSWDQVYLPSVPTITANSSMDMWYGGGRFVLWLDDPVGPSRQVFISLRSTG